jgi:hypothetical protein
MVEECQCETCEGARSEPIQEEFNMCAEDFLQDVIDFESENMMPMAEGNEPA